MNKEQAVKYLRFSGFSDEQIKAIEGAFTCEDAISRQAVLKIIDGWYDNNRDTENIEDLIVLITYMSSVNPQKPICPSAGIDCEDCPAYEDAISRQAVLDALDKSKYSNEFCEEHHIDWSINLGMAHIVVNELKPVTPQLKTGWIPVSERLPNKGGEYFLWGKIYESDEEDYCFIGDYHEFDEVFGTEISNYNPKTLGFIDTEIEEFYSVVAWMPLPEPYKTEGSGE